LIFDEVKGGFLRDGIADCHVWRRLWKEMGRFWWILQAPANFVDGTL
jgi:hypothetical protein